jgi:hypoxanthine phosphoribosyltransferase
MEERTFVTWSIFEKSVKYLLKEITSASKERNFDGIYALPRGGLCLGVKLSYLSGLPLITDSKMITDNTIIVDDCTDTGGTLSQYKGNFTAVMFHKPTSMFKPDIYYQETNNQINFCWESAEERN